MNEKIYLQRMQLSKEGSRTVTRSFRRVERLENERNRNDSRIRLPYHGLLMVRRIAIHKRAQHSRLAEQLE